jgi:hypothetical protein
MPTVQSHSSSDKRLDRAVHHVSALWFPINPSVLRTIREGLERGSYNSDISPLIDELKKDFALFTYVVKELLPVATKEKVPKTLSENPIQLMRWAGLEKLTPILGTQNEPPSTHQLESCASFQSNRLRETAIIASTAEVLSKSQNLDPEMGFSHGVIREIGLNLIAWNYPSLYARVVKSLTPRTTVDEELTKELGFSPAVLAMRILRPCAEQSPRQGSQKEEDPWETYESLCQIGEALAHAGNPETYPSAQNDWRRANDYITKFLGDDGVDLIRARAIEHTEHYKSTLPGTFASLASFNPINALERHKLGSRASENQYLRHCPPAVQAALQSLYSEMPSGNVSKEAIEQLVKKIIPQAGFTGGCVFLVDPSQMSLLPLSVIGSVRLRRLGKINLKTAPGSAMAGLIADNITTSLHATGDPALVAFNCSQPLIEREGTEIIESTAGIYSSLGTKRRIGVLYLEAPEDKVGLSDSSTVKTFKALRQALCDALMVD